MKKPSKRKAIRKPRELWMISWPNSWWSGAFETREIAEEARKQMETANSDNKNGKSVLFREVLPKRRGAR